MSFSHRSNDPPDAWSAASSIDDDCHDVSDLSKCHRSDVSDLRAYPRHGDESDVLALGGRDGDEPIVLKTDYRGRYTTLRGTTQGRCSICCGSPWWNDAATWPFSEEDEIPGGYA